MGAAELSSALFFGFELAQKDRMTFAHQMLSFFENLEPPELPEGVVPMLPFQDPQILEIMDRFYLKFYNDDAARTLLFGINPGRLGAGKTGIGFTDPVRLKEQCGIDHHLDLKAEPSSVFMYEMIDKFGGVEAFYNRFHFTSVSPVGYIHNGVNFNYYDTPALKKATLPFIVTCIQHQLTMNVNRRVAFSIGKGKNFKILQKLNDQYGFFERIETLPHPRWVMQYRYKNKDSFMDDYLERLLE